MVAMATIYTSMIAFMVAMVTIFISMIASMLAMVTIHHGDGNHVGISPWLVWKQGSLCYVTNDR